MELIIIKNGAMMFDALHSLGLAVTVATATQEPVRLVEAGTCYRLTSPTDTLPADLPLADLLPLPSAGEVQVLTKLPDKISRPLAVFDGLLAALLTVPGKKRLISLADLLHAKAQWPEIATDLLKKVAEKTTVWEEYLACHSNRADGWLTAMLADYQPDQPAIPISRPKRSNDLSVWMSLDPAFGFTACRPISDHLVRTKTNLALAIHFATFLAIVGASHFLRAQRVAGQQVNFYVPCPLDVTLVAATTLPPLRVRDLPPAEAMLANWLSLPALPGKWAGLSYQTLQMQGTSQPISVERGWLDWCWLVNLTERIGRKPVRYWRKLLITPPGDRPVDIDPLLTMLTARSSTAWQAHLLEISRRQFDAKVEIPLYTVNEVKEVISAMNSHNPVPLYEILTHDDGTLRFGHALRQLALVNKTALRDVLLDLDTVQTRDQLLRVLAQIMQTCIVTGAKSKFIIIPSDDDIAYLLADVEHYTPKTVARLLVLLSVLRYPYSNKLPRYRTKRVSRDRKIRHILMRKERPSRSRNRKKLRS